ncbi:fatty acid desaturase family protein [Bacillus sp. FJAT-45350]|uniref:fatty acid desaturase family protein n=1 Tax=Bacillus sp. FJAT-45350 TaxID=2011014 RepID=UPI000BB96614|nr:acyl-CoA desaturase [Bacillus sp. FJAT-45350]
MKDLHSFGWYAAKLQPDLPKEVFEPVPARLLGGLAYLIVVVAGILTIGLVDLNIWLKLLISAVLGFSFSGLGFLGHEILHGSVVKTPWLRNFLGGIAFFPLSTGPRLWRKWHNVEHHVHTQNEHKDPDAWPTIQRFLKMPLIVRLAYKLPMSVRSFVSFSLLTVSFSLHSMRMFGRYVRSFKPSKRPMVWFQMLFPWAVWISLLGWMGFSNWLFAFVIPLFIGNAIVMAYIATNHRLNPIVDVNDPLANCLSVTVPKWLDVLHFNFSYHTEHHLFPAMNPKHYPMVKAHILKKWPERYFEMPFGKALIALWKTPRLYQDKTELVDPTPGNVYDTLGNGFDQKNIKPRKSISTDEIALGKSVVTERK